jgi:ABC-type transporter lipoprotein component MlaA
VRDLAGRMLDLSLLSATVGGLFSSPYYGPVRGTMASIDDRVEFDAKLHQLRDETPDGYSSVRQYYLDERAAEIEGLHRKKATRRAPTTQLLSPPLKTPPIATD